MFEGVRYRPSIRRPPSQTNLRRARERLDEIKPQIDLGTFSFSEEFRFLRHLIASAKARSCNDVFDEFRFFTGMRLSEEIALVLSDLDLVNGIVSVNKARVAGIDRCQTKTGEDRRIALCPRALAVLKRQLPLRARFHRAGVVRHEHVFFCKTGAIRIDVCARLSKALTGSGWDGAKPILALEQLSIARGERIFMKGPSARTQPSRARWRCRPGAPSTAPLRSSVVTRPVVKYLNQDYQADAR